MISKIDLWQIFKEHEKETGVVLNPLMRNHIIEILQRVDKFQNKPECPKSPTGKHNWRLPPDSFDSPYCGHCGKIDK